MTELQVASAPKPQTVMHTTEPAVPSADQVKQVPEAVSPPKVDFATDLFNMLSMDGPAESGAETLSADDNGWAGFQCMYEPRLSCIDVFFGSILHLCYVCTYAPWV